MHNLLFALEETIEHSFCASCGVHNVGNGRKDPHILSAAVKENRRILTPLWRDLLEEGIKDGSIQTKYAKELSELLPLINFWFMPSVFPATQEELHHKYSFVMEVLTHMGLPILDDVTAAFTEKVITDISAKGENE